MKKNNKIILLVSISLLIIILASSLILCLGVIPSIKRKEQEKLVKQYYNSKIAMYEQENLQYEDYEVDVAFLGDSLTDGYNLKEFYPQYLTANRGISGDTTFGLEKRLKVSAYDLKPKVVVMLIGANNMNKMFDNYEDILIGLKENLPNTKVVLLSLTSMGEEWGKKNNLAAFNNVKIKMLASKYNFEFVDLYSPLLNKETNEIYSNYTTDGGHLTYEGYQVLTNEITPTLYNLLGK